MMRDEAVSLRDAVRHAIAEGEVFAAYDLARSGLERHTEDDALRLLGAIALVRTGAVEAAREEVAKTSLAGRAPKHVVRSIDAGLLLADVRQAIGEADPDPAELERALAIRLELAAIERDFANLARAALLAEELGDRERARELAGKAMRVAPRPEAASPEVLLDLADLAIIFDQEPLAVRYLERLAGLVALRPMQRVLVRQRLEALVAQGAPVAPSWLDRFEPPRIVIFTGPRLGNGHDTFSPVLEEGLTRAIGERFDELRPEIAFGSLSAGCDLLFTDALLARGAQLNVILPFAREDFLSRFVEPYGSLWVERFERALARARSVVEVCREPYLGDEVILRFGNQVIDGTARLRGTALASPPYLVAVFDYLAEQAFGSPSDFIDHWGDPERLRVIDLEPISSAVVSEDPADAAGAPGPAGQGSSFLPPGKQRITAVLFADVVGYSQLRDNELPNFWRFMEAVTAQVERSAPSPWLIDSWGDAILAVHDRAVDAAEYALALRESFTAMDSRDFGLQQRLQLRIALHAGPAFDSRHPLTGQRLVYGGNINRAARIEPITVPGHAYASEQFVAMVTAEESMAEAEIRLQGGIHRPRYHCTFRGTLDLAKGYGRQSIYEIKPWRPDAGPVELDVGRRLRVVLSNELGEHRRLAELFVQLIAPTGMANDHASVFELAFDEILTNICNYAWADQARHMIDVEIVVEGDQIEASFRDDGLPFDPLTVSLPAPADDIDEHPEGGLGIHLVRELMDNVRYAREGAINRLTIVKRLGQDDASEDPSKEAS